MANARTTPPNLAYPAFLNTNPTQDVSISVTKLLGRHTMKTGFYSNHSRKQQNLNQRNALPFQGQLSFANDTNNPLDTGFGFANAAVGVYTAYTQQSSFVEGKFVYNQIEGYIQDNWRVNNKLTLDYGVRLTHQQPQYDANGQASNFFLDQYSRSAAPVQYAPGCPGNVFPCEATRQAMNPATGQLMGAGTAALIGQIVPNTGNLTNGIVRAGDGISKYNYEWPALTAAPRFGAAYSVKDDQSLVIRGGIGLFYDRPGRRFDLLPVAESPDVDEPDRAQRPAADAGHGQRRGEPRRADPHQLPVRQSESSAITCSGTSARKW